MIRICADTLEAAAGEYGRSIEKGRIANIVVTEGDLFDSGRVRRARTLREFDDVFTAPLHGFRDTEDYWTRSSSKPWLSAIRVPTLVLNARNDPFLPASALPAPQDASIAVQCEFPGEGGHAGFVTGPFPGRDDWLPRRLIAFFLTRLGSR